MTTATALDRLLDPLAMSLSVEVARQLAQFRVDPVTQDHLDDLAARANEGQLSPDEQAEYAALVTAMDLVSVLQSKARRVLRTSATN